MGGEAVRDPGHRQAQIGLPADLWPLQPHYGGFVVFSRQRPVLAGWPRILSDSMCLQVLLALADH